MFSVAYFFAKFNGILPHLFYISLISFALLQSVKNRAGEEYQRISGIQRRGARGDNNYSSYNSDGIPFHL